MSYTGSSTEEDLTTTSEDGETAASGTAAGLRLGLPKSTRDVYKTFTLSATNQILRGVSPTHGPSGLSPRYYSEFRG